MKIDTTLQPGANSGAAPLRGRGTGKVGGGNPVEEVRLSEFAAQIKPAGDEAMINPARVAEIRQAISEGRFTINADAIAGRLLDTAKELLGAQRRA